MEEINKEKERISRKKWLPKTILIVVVIFLIAIGYIFSTDSFKSETEIPIVGRLDYQTPFGLFSELPIEEGIKIEESTLISYKGGNEIKTISYKSNKLEEELFIDFFNYLENNGWIIENEISNSFIYAVKHPDILNILIEKDKNENISVNISHTKLELEETE